MSLAHSSIGQVVLFTFLITSSQSRSMPYNSPATAPKSSGNLFTSSVNWIEMNGMIDGNATVSTCR